MNEHVYKLAATVKHDGDTYLADTEVDLSGKPALEAELLEMGFVLKPVAPPASQPKDPGNGDQPKDPAGQGLDADIAAAIDLLDSDNSDHYTTAGLPSVYAIEDLLDKQIKSADRDRVWATHPRNPKWTPVR